MIGDIVILALLRREEGKFVLLLNEWPLFHLLETFLVISYTPNVNQILIFIWISNFFNLVASRAVCSTLTAFFMTYCMVKNLDKYIFFNNLDFLMHFWLIYIIYQTIGHEKCCFDHEKCRWCWPVEKCSGQCGPRKVQWSMSTEKSAVWSMFIDRWCCWCPNSGPVHHALQRAVIDCDNSTRNDSVTFRRSFKFDEFRP